MNKTERLSFIESLVKKHSSGRLETDKTGIEEETKLATANDSDESILDEEQKESFVSSALVKATERTKTKIENEDEILLSQKDLTLLSKEMGRGISFLKMKKKEGGEEADEINLDNVNIGEVLEWASKQT